MDCSWPDTSPFDQRKAADELLRGHELAQQLQAYLRRSSNSGGTASQDLVSRILTSFSKTLSILNRCDSDDMNGSIVDSPEEHASRKSEESGDSCKSSTPNTDRRGCYKRRKSCQSWARESSSLVDDGHAWRKYGQKTILNAKYPRNYYRCTHKFDQACQATKQVQRLQEHPPKFRTTYYGHHTCSNFLKASDILLSSSNFDDSCGVLLSFDTPETTAAAPNFSLPHDATLVKKEVVTAEGRERDDEAACSPSDYMSTAVPSPDDHLSEVFMGSVVDFEDDVLQFHFSSN
ncbi:WRKY DNA-binding transcription factor 70-like [Benincasa hispida]|uniref:WRKY DNA-binding transcription factor 70-like n=1 Tax=Benincasa hispida TaxID=102211 RepID=UPI0018FFA169|nr:WRKY DNA-binding transcription factor 70-like [Benincasa hispida]